MVETGGSLGSPAAFSGQRAGRDPAGCAASRDITAPLVSTHKGRVGASNAKHREVDHTELPLPIPRFARPHPNPPRFAGEGAQLA